MGAKISSRPFPSVCLCSSSTAEFLCPVLLCATVRPQTFGPQIERDQRLISAGAQINHRSTLRPAFTRHAAELCTHRTASSHLLYVWTSKGSLNLGKTHKILLTDLTVSPQLNSFSGNSVTWIFVIAAAAWTDELLPPQPHIASLEGRGILSTLSPRFIAYQGYPDNQQDLIATFTHSEIP